jgi:hypothetical protein
LLSDVSVKSSSVKKYGMFDPEVGTDMLSDGMNVYTYFRVIVVFKL